MEGSRFPKIGVPSWGSPTISLDEDCSGLCNEKKRETIKMEYPKEEQMENEMDIRMRKGIRVPLK